MSNRLDLYVGDASAIVFPIVDENGNTVALTSATAAKFTVRSYAGASTAILDLTGSVNTTTHKVTVTPSQPQADALVPGEYVGQVAIQFTTPWRKSNLFTVRVLAAVATT